MQDSSMRQGARQEGQEGIPNHPTAGNVKAPGM